MSEAYTPVANKPTTVTLPTDNDPPVAATWRPGMEGALDYCQWLYENGQSGQASLWVPVGAPIVNTDSRFSYDYLAGSYFGWYQSDITDAGELVFRAPRMFSGTLTQIDVWVHGAGDGAGHGGTLPANKPAAFAKWWDLVTFAGSSTAAVTDPSPDAATYDTLHAIPLPLAGPGLTLTGTTEIAIRLIGEYGANSVAGLALAGIELTVTP